jgi:beta-glucosidase
MSTSKRLTVLLGAILTALSCAAPEPKIEGLGFTPPPGGQPLTAYDPQIDQLLSRMTLAEKIGQMTQPDQQYLKDPSDIETLFIGSLLSGGDSDPREGNSFEAWRDMVERYRQHALRTRLAIPLLYGVDAVHGHSNVLGAVIFPHNVGLGATHNPELVAQVSRVTAVEMRATGIHWTFAPCVTVPRDDRWGRVYEGFSEDPELVKVLGEAAVRGLQGEDLSHPLSVLACSKHYLGDGGTTWGTGTVARSDGTRYPLDRGDTRVDEPTLRRLHLPGYVTTIAAGVGSIMPSYSSWNGTKLSGHKYLLTDLLKDELGFQGFLISDYNAIDELPGSYREQVKLSVNAGMDMMMVPERYREFIETLTSLVEAGEVPMERIDDAVRRILRVKFAMGLFSEQPQADRSLAEKFGSAEHRAVAREAVRQSVVLLKNEGVLPLSKTARRIHVAGRGADNLGMQCGGWTIKWQGGMGRITDGTTILEAVRQAVTDGTEVSYSEDGSGASGADLALVVVGEEPYAEFLGDREDLSLSADDIASVERVKATGVRTVVVLLSGRPLILEPILNQADAIVAAWLPGSEGQGVTDVLFGDYRPTGKLPFSWPRTMDQVPVNVGDEPYQPLYPYGYGLSY